MEHHEQSTQVQYLELHEFISLLISRRRLERVWSRMRRTLSETGMVVRDATTGEFFAAKIVARTTLTLPRGES